jgi:L-rhamnose isomerase
MDAERPWKAAMAQWEMNVGENTQLRLRFAAHVKNTRPAKTRHLTFLMPASKSIVRSFSLARERYAELGVDVDAALKNLRTLRVSVHCWQGDDIGGFENGSAALGGGLAVTGNYPGKARTVEELRADMDAALALIPGTHRVNLHAMYGEFGGKRVDRDAIGVEHFANWIAWAKARGLGLDFNPTCFAHAKAVDGFTLAHPDAGIRRFWIEHCRRAREIGAAMGKALGTPTVTNFWVPDGYKDAPANRVAPRERLAASLDAVFKKPLPAKHHFDSVEPKLFGIGSECYVVGSYDFYLGYAITRQKVLCLDAGHFHPTESVSDKISSVFQYVPRVLLHMSRGVRWDSDHVILYNDELTAIAQELVRGGYLGRTHLGLDYFDASINRIAAWVIGTRNFLKALLAALLEPHARLVAAENDGDHATRLALQEEAKLLPLGAVWDAYCEEQGVPTGEKWLGDVKRYEREVLSKRS